MALIYVCLISFIRLPLLGATDPRAALVRHQQNVASYQYILTRFPTYQKVLINRRLLT